MVANIKNMIVLYLQIFFLKLSNFREYEFDILSFAASKLLNPVALFRTASSRSSSSRFLVNSSSTRMESNEGTKDISEEHCRLSGSHQSTLDKLNAWEKKLYEEVKVH